MRPSTFLRLVPAACAIAAIVACADSAPTAVPTDAVSVSSPLASSGSSGNGGDVQRLELRDDCDSVSFNAQLGPGGCIRRGSVTFQKFIDELTKKKDVGAWKNNPDKFDANFGTTISVVNIGGETHTFTRVANFGGGFVQVLNDLSGNKTVAPECATPNPATFVAAGGTMQVKTGTGTQIVDGTYKFQCCIHPWMRTTATFKKK